MDHAVDEVKQKVLEIVAEQAVLEVSDIQPTATADSLGLDSLGLVETVFAIETQFDISLPFNASAPGMGGYDSRTIESITQEVSHLIAEREAATP